MAPVSPLSWRWWCIMCLPMSFLMSGVDGGVGGAPADLKAEAEVTAHRMHHQLNMRGPHHPRSSEAMHHSKPHYQLRRPGIGSDPAPKITQDTKLLRDEEHIQEDLKNLLPGEDIKKMSPEELEFYYFKLHDFDNNTKLDGLEILQAIHHVMHVGDDQSEHSEEGSDQLDEVRAKSASATNFVEDGEKLEDDDDLSYFVELIDKVLEEDDLDNDGFLSYIEYVKGRKKDQMKREKKNKKI